MTERWHVRTRTFSQCQVWPWRMKNQLLSETNWQKNDQKNVRATVRCVGQLLLDQGFSQHSNVCGMWCDPAHLRWWLRSVNAGIQRMERNVSRHGIPTINETLRRQRDCTKRTNGGRKVRSLVRSLRIRQVQKQCIRPQEKTLRRSQSQPNIPHVQWCRSCPNTLRLASHPSASRPRNGNDGGKDSFITDLTRLIFWRSDQERRQSVNQQ